MYKLYYSPQSCSMAVYLVLELMGVDYEAIKVEIGSEEFKTIAPKGAVPAFQDGDSPIMTQSVAILQYLLQKHPESNLGTDGSAWQNYELNNALAFVSGDMHPAYWDIFAAMYTQDEGAKEVLNNTGYNRVRRQLQYMNEMLEGRDYLVFDKLTVADLFVYIIAGWAMGMLPEGLKNYPNIVAHQEKIYNIPKVKQIMDTYNV